MKIKTHGLHEGEEDKKTETMMTADNHQEGGNVDMQEKMIAYNEKDVTTNPNRQDAST